MARWGWTALKLAEMSAKMLAQKLAQMWALLTLRAALQVTARQLGVFGATKCRVGWRVGLLRGLGE